MDLRINWIGRLLAVLLCLAGSTERQAAAARKTLKRRSDWPYLPTMRAPWCWQYH